MTGLSESNHNQILALATNVERLLTKREVAAFFRITERTLEEWMKHGKVPHFKVGKSVRFRLNDLIKNLEAKNRIAP